MELYVYYRVPAGRLAEAVSAAQAMQQGLVRDRPGLVARLLRRTDAAAGADEVTLMETYALPGGLDEGFAAVLDAAAAPWSAALGAGARHAERFAPLAG